MANLAPEALKYIYIYTVHVRFLDLLLGGLGRKKAILPGRDKEDILPVVSHQ